MQATKQMKAWCKENRDNLSRHVAGEQYTPENVPRPGNGFYPYRESCHGPCVTCGNETAYGYPASVISWPDAIRCQYGKFVYTCCKPCSQTFVSRIQETKQGS